MAKQRIAVLGGGVGALSAAFYITEQPGWADKYELTVYQQGWRLGGKCASGHDMREGYGHRIYEHGLHIFGGFYYQAFDLLRRAYKALDRPDGHPNQDVWDAFTPEDGVGLVDNSPEAAVDPIWYLDFPPNFEVPGDDLTTPTVADSITALVSRLIHLTPAHTDPSPKPSPQPTHGGSPLHQALDLLKKYFGDLKEEIQERESQWILDTSIRLMEAHARLVGAQPTEGSDLTITRGLLAIFLVQTIVQG